MSAWDDAKVEDVNPVEPVEPVEPPQDGREVLNDDGDYLLDGRYFCAGCGADFKTRPNLTRHKRENGHGSSTGATRPRRTDDASPSRERGRPPKVGRQSRREQAIRETIEEAVQLAKVARGGPQIDVASLVDVLDRDKARLAVSISWLAEKFNPLGKLIDWTMGHGGVLTIVRGFSGVGSWTLGKWRTMLVEREQQVDEPLFVEDLPVEPVEPVEPGPAPGDFVV